MDFLLWQFDIIIDVLNDGPSKLSEGTNKEAIEQSREPKKEPGDATTPKGAILGLVSDDTSKVVPEPTLILMKDGAGVGSSSAPSVTPGIYVPEQGLTRASFLMQHLVAYEWGCHAFPPTTIMALEILSNSHMSNSL